MPMMKTGTPVPFEVVNKTESEILIALEKLSFTLKTASEDECQRALTALLNRKISLQEVSKFVTLAKQQ